MPVPHFATTVVIAHRLSTIVGADIIAVLEGGTVIEQGSFDELVERGGRFATMWKNWISSRDSSAARRE